MAGTEVRVVCLWGLVPSNVWNWLNAAGVDSSVKCEPAQVLLFARSNAVCMSNNRTMFHILRENFSRSDDHLMKMPSNAL